MALEHITDPEARRREEVLQRLVREYRERQLQPGLPIRFRDERAIRKRAEAEQLNNA